MGRSQRHRNRLRQMDARPNIRIHSVAIETLHQVMKRRKWENETKLQIRSFDGERGVCSKISLDANETLIKVPFSCLISTHTFPPETIGLLRSRTQLSLQTWLAVFLCVEKRKQNSSPWKFYLDSLPERSPLQWMSLNSQARSAFPPHVVAKMAAFCERFEASWQAAKEALRGSLEEVGLTRAAFEWAYAMVNTRAIYVAPDVLRSLSHADVLSAVSGIPNIALCPFLDMFNHCPTAQTSPEVVFEAGQHHYVLKTCRRQRKKQQIFISYGGHDNVFLLVEYGFFVPANPFDSWPIPFEVLKTFVRYEAKAYKCLLSRGFDKNLRLRVDGTMSFNLKAALCLSLVTFNQANRAFTEDLSCSQMDAIRTIISNVLKDLWRWQTSSAKDVLGCSVMLAFFEYLLQYYRELQRQYAIVN